MKCICGEEIGEPPFKSWEECFNCESKLFGIARRKKIWAVVEVAREASDILERICDSFPDNKIPHPSIGECLPVSVVLKREIEALDNGSEE